MEQLERRISRIKRRLKKRKAWIHGYLDDFVDNQTRIIANNLYNQGLEAQVKFLLEHGITVNEIVKEGKRVRKLVVDHFTGMAENGKHKHRHRNRHSDH